MRKRIVTMSVVVVLAFAVFALGGCGKSGKKPEDGPSAAVDTFAGVASEQGYASAEDAAKAFLQNEVERFSVRATYTGTKEKSALFSGEVAALALSDGDKAAVTAAKKVAVQYKRAAADEEYGMRAHASAPVYAAARAQEDESADEVTEQTMYLLTLSDGTVKYYTPLSEEGEYITYSYFMSVVDYTHYVNSCMEVECYSWEGKKGNWDGQSLPAQKKDCVFEMGLIHERTANASHGMFFRSYQDFTDRTPKVCVEADDDEAESDQYVWAEENRTAYYGYTFYADGSEWIEIVGRESAGYEKTYPDEQDMAHADWAREALEGDFELLFDENVDWSSVKKTAGGFGYTYEHAFGNMLEKATVKFVLKAGRFDSLSVMRNEYEPDGDAQSPLDMQYMEMRFSAFGTTSVTVPENVKTRFAELVASGSEQ